MFPPGAKLPLSASATEVEAAGPCPCVCVVDFGVCSESIVGLHSQALRRLWAFGGTGVWGVKVLAAQQHLAAAQDATAFDVRG